MPGLELTDNNDFLHPAVVPSVKMDEINAGWRDSADFIGTIPSNRVIE